MLPTGIAAPDARATSRVRSGSAVRYAAATMTSRGSFLLVALLLAGCGGSVEGGTTWAGGSGGVAGGGGTGGVVVHPDGGPDAYPDSGPDALPDASHDVQSDYVEPPCPDAAPLPVTEECDLFAKPTTCPVGQGCYPFVQHPAGPCQLEQYGTLCEPVGTGHQSDPCAGGDCAAGFVCVITGAGNQCVRLCHLGSSKDCPSGLVCMPIDSDGYGGCY